MIVPRILAELCGPDQSPTQHLETQQALVKQFAEILEFTLKFDELKASTLVFFRGTSCSASITDAPFPFMKIDSY